MLARHEWYQAQGIEPHIGDRAGHIDRQAKIVHSDNGLSIPYDHVILATGSYPFVPRFPESRKPAYIPPSALGFSNTAVAFADAASSAAIIVVSNRCSELVALLAAIGRGLVPHVVEFTTLDAALG